MGYKELIASLRREGEEKADEIRRTAVAETNRIKEESATEIQMLRNSYARRRADAVAAEEERLVADSRRRAERVRLDAEAALVERLYGVARDSLAELRDERYDGQFASLVGELLPCSWETVRINPADTALARSYFPDARIVEDNAISGGIWVSGDGGRLTIDNTFEKRLERCWPELAVNVTAKVLRLV